ncbi:MAG: hypothetical protein ABEJ83_00480 [Candidatus Nanohaloarchaea archaeon]
MLRKGALESGLGEILLTVLVAAVISGAMFGPLGAKVGQGFKEAEKFTDVTTTVTVDDKETLGDLSQYVFWRAWGCDKVSSETFEGLSDTSLGSNPPCAGAGGTLVSDINNLYANTGNDMEGKFSRVNFVINDTITLKTGLGFGTDGKSATLLGVSTGDRVGKSGYSDWIWSGCTKYQPGVNDDWGNSWESKGPPYSFYTLFFKNGGGSERIQKIGSGKTIEDRYDDNGYNDPIYCDEWNDGPWLTKPSSNTGNPKDHEDTGGNYVKVKLCPGDKGYIETRKGYPNIAGEYGRRTATVNNGNLYGMIQITSMNQSCRMNEGEAGTGGNEPLNPAPEVWPDGSTYTVLSKKVRFDNSGTNPGVFKWDVSGGQKKLNLSLEFDEIGHVVVMRRPGDNAGQQGFFEINPNGNKKLWFSCSSCGSSFEDSYFADKGRISNDGYGYTGVKIERNKQYSFVVQEYGGTGDTKWTIYKEGSKVFDPRATLYGFDNLILTPMSGRTNVLIDMNRVN